LKFKVAPGKQGSLFKHQPKFHKSYGAESVKVLPQSVILIVL